MERTSRELDSATCAPISSAVCIALEVLEAGGMMGFCRIPYAGICTITFSGFSPALNQAPSVSFWNE